jgi:hypothetical protein
MKETEKQHLYEIKKQRDSTIAIEKECIRSYGFVANPTKKIWENIPSALKTIQATTYLNSPFNLHCHNLCTKLLTPIGFNQLLSLGLNFCIERSKPTPNIKYTLNKLNRNVRLKAWLEKNPLEQDNYNPNLYLPSHWQPPEAPERIEQCLQNFEKQLTEITKHNNANSTSRSNLSRLQKNCLKKIMSDRCFIVCLSDKNLGPVLMERNTYLERCLTDHLLCTDTYIQLTENDATNLVQRTRSNLLQLRLKHRNDLTEAENTFFRRNANLKHRLPQFYITIKIHKNPYKTRPIVSCVGSFLHAFSKWVDSHLQKLLPFNPTYVRDTQHLINDLKHLQNLPCNAKLFTCDAESMYTNINHLHGIETIKKWLEDFSE